MIVKICGLTTLEDSLAAVEAGADMLGFNFYPPSPRYISTQVCQQIVSGLQHSRRKPVLVGVFVNAGWEEINHAMKTCSLDLAQLCGDEPPDLLDLLGERAFKALRPASAEAVQEAVQRYPVRKQPPTWLVDAYRAGSYGGSGQVADWGLASGLASQAPILLAGGLTPENVAAAVDQVRPWGVDVASGVESSPGRKDWHKMKEFILAAKQAAAEVEN